MKYEILKSTKCRVDNHVWIWGGVSSTSEPLPDMRCDCGEFSWEEMMKIVSVEHSAETDGDQKPITMLRARRIALRNLLRAERLRQQGRDAEAKHYG